MLLGYYVFLFFSSHLFPQPFLVETVLLVSVQADGEHEGQKSRARVLTMLANVYRRKKFTFIGNRCNGSGLLEFKAASILRVSASSAKEQEICPSAFNRLPNRAGKVDP